MPNRSRVLYLYPYLNLDTGSPKAMVQFIDLLDRSLFAPVYCAGGTGPLTEALASRGVEIVPWGEEDSVSFRRPVAATAAIRRQVRMLKRWKVDLIHANCFPWNTPLLVAAGIVGVPVILHVHNPVDVSFQNLNRIAARKVLFCSSAVMHNCPHFQRVAAKAEILYNVIDVEAWGRGSSIRSSLGIGEDEIVIGTVAQIVHGKGIDILLETARTLLHERKDLVFLIAGPRTEKEEEFGGRMLAAAQEPVLNGRVRFLGSRSDIPDLLASLDLFVLPTRAEALGIAVLEAMAAGLPVIASKVGGIPEMLTSPEIGMLVDPISPEAFARAIREVLSRADQGRSMGLNARASLTGRFDAATGGKRLNRIYLEVLGRD